ncbi:MAG: hypothetical protein IJ026_00040 [Candidatus Methanomethylophilaceae archaeon]|nr:hypothetical protein [Candidatus Methanomethylophilaceae archaeon]
MDLNKNQIIAIGVVAIIIVAAAAILVLNGDDDKKGDAEYGQYSFRLDVYGNANEDLVIDDKDLEIIQDIVDGKATAGDYPLADADKNGAVDSKDKDLVNKIIKGQDCTVQVICLDENGNDVVKAVEFPVKNAVPYGSNMTGVFINAGGVDHCAGYMSKKTSYPEMNSELFNSDAVAIEISRQMTTAGWEQFISLDAALIESTGKGVDAFFVDHSVTALSKSSVYRDDLAAAGIPEIRLAVADPIGDVNAALLIGFLCDDDQGYNYASESIRAFALVEDALSGLDKDDQKTYICETMGCYVCQNDSTFNTMPSYVGGMPYYIVNDEFAALYEGTSSVKMEGPETLSNFDDAEFIWCSNNLDIQTGDYSNTIIAEYEEYASYYETLDNREQRVLINAINPGIIKLAFVASIMYPDLVDEDILQEVFDIVSESSITLDGHTMSEACVAITYEDYVNAKGA